MPEKFHSGPVVHAAKMAVARAMCSATTGRLIARVTRDRVRHFDIEFDTGPAQFHPAVKAKLFWGLYERAEIRMISKWFTEPRVVIELGSSLGICASHLATKMTDGGRLVCVEADARVLDVLASNLSSHAPHLETTLVHAAVASKSAASSGTVDFSPSGITTGSQLRRKHETSAGVTVPAITLSSLLALHRIGAYSLVCDIEGAEAFILLEDSAGLRLCTEAIFEFHEVEIDGRRIYPGEMLARLIDLGFRLVDRRGDVVYVRRERA